MTADAIYDRVLALMFSGANEKTDMQNQFLATLNIFLAELFTKENFRRKEKMTAPPIITSLSEVVDYHQDLLAFLPYGIAGTMLAEDDPNIAVQYKNKYEEERAKCLLCVFDEVSNDAV